VFVYRFDTILFLYIVLFVFVYRFGATLFLYIVLFLFVYRVGATLFMYIVSGVLIQIFVRKESGARAIPNHDFWVAVPSHIKASTNSFFFFF
jgi:hypothetical protein